MKKKMRVYICNWWFGFPNIALLILILSSASVGSNKVKFSFVSNFCRGVLMFVQPMFSQIRNKLCLINLRRPAFEIKLPCLRLKTLYNLRCL